MVIVFLLHKKLNIILDELRQMISENEMGLHVKGLGSKKCFLPWQAGTRQVGTQVGRVGGWEVGWNLHASGATQPNMFRLSNSLLTSLSRLHSESLSGEASSKKRKMSENCQMIKVIKLLQCCRLCSFNNISMKKLLLNMHLKFSYLNVNLIYLLYSCPVCQL